MLNGRILKGIKFLNELAKKVHLDDQPYIKMSLYQLSMRWDDRVAAGLYQYLYDQVDGSLFIDDVFEIPIQDDFESEMVLGRVKNRQRIEFRHSLNKLPMHILAAGTSGSGKSNFAKILIEQALKSGVGTIMISDPKSEYNDIAMKYPDFIILKWKDLRFNPFKPPPNVPENEWSQTVVGHLSQSFNFWEGVMSLLLKLITKDSKNGKCPTVFSLLEAIETNKAKFQYKDLVIKSTASSRLELLVNVFEEVISCESNMLPVLRNKNYILQTTGLMPEIESWLLEYLLLWEFNYRLFNPTETDLSLHVYDECQHRLFNAEKEKNIKKISASVISMLVDEARSSNIGICALSQEPSVLIKSILNNSWLKIAFHLGSGQEVAIMKGAMGLNYDQADTMHYLETGEGIVRTGGGIFIEPCPIMFYEFVTPCGVKLDDFLNHQKTMKQELYKESDVKEFGGAGNKNSDKGKNGRGDLFEEDYDVLF
jgi:hypothetical protein